ncbi:putative iron-regulated membrane protein [Acetobacter nitrogenifigens DSM 23921 = NBRC 105050]|uniref:Iron-regulated membrane protein n=1 Tax=Acetobacter nitrogenifigens DSM 23921 = NBRC 105050 TaxID=1120919 RepID=A0A511X6I0_9PROT|nr:PepSY-associated TM helix domain-containing protein [Acetobacter nitrogenifigens]GBQ94533.1 putative iron-regulated membrane protein [Acetobacter nitrogenifigens DSM 23921 = NBRC 105050]GEN58549.1 iron-regulated membrane protein [Acetobacter nitrogenifigens DSM 23921 = NBRC 105050]
MIRKHRSHLSGPSTSASPAPPSLRARMGWLHAWVGFIAGAVLVCMFTTGTLAVFDREITRWMQPEMTLGAAYAPSATALDKAAVLLTEGERAGGRAFLSLPSEREPGLSVLHLENDAFVGQTLDPRDGSVIPLRNTTGGDLFFRFHYTLHLGHLTGVIIAQLLAAGFLVTLMSGLVMHYRAMLPNLLTFRPNAPRQRSWLDAHLLAAVMFLPFLIMEPYTGIMIHANRLFPTGGEPRGGAHHGEGRPDGKRAPSEHGRGMKGDGDRHGRKMDASASAPEESPAGATQPPPLGAMYEQAVGAFGAGHIGFAQPRGDRITFVRGDDATLRMTRDHIDFDRLTGRSLGLTREATAAAMTRQAMAGLHMARWAPSPVRWLYFASGAAGATMMSTGLILFLMKRRKNAGEHPVAMALGEALAMTAIIGLPVGCAAVFWANRLLPATMAARASWETSALFVVWLACAAHALLSALRRRVHSAWREETAILALALGLLPALDLVTRWPWIQTQSWSVQSTYWGVDATALTFAAISGALWWLLGRAREAARHVRHPASANAVGLEYGS